MLTVITMTKKFQELMDEYNADINTEKALENVVWGNDVDADTYWKEVEEFRKMAQDEIDRLGSVVVDEKQEYFRHVEWFAYYYLSNLRGPFKTNNHIIRMVHLYDYVRSQYERLIYDAENQVRINAENNGIVQLSTGDTQILK